MCTAPFTRADKAREAVGRSLYEPEPAQKLATTRIFFGEWRPSSYNLKPIGLGTFKRSQRRGLWIPSHFEDHLNLDVLEDE